MNGGTMMSSLFQASLFTQGSSAKNGQRQRTPPSCDIIGVPYLNVEKFHYSTSTPVYIFLIKPIFFLLKSNINIK